MTDKAPPKAAKKPTYSQMVTAAIVALKGGYDMDWLLMTQMLISNRVLKTTKKNSLSKFMDRFYFFSPLEITFFIFRSISLQSLKFW